MQIEHITLGGNSTLRDSNGIFPETIELLRGFQIREGRKTLPFPRTGFSVRVTSAKEGALFDIVKGNDISITNVCCFDDDHTITMFDHVKQLHNTMKFGDPRLPVMSQWIYSIMINPFALGLQDMSIAGEVELYIYYSLYLARQ
jgi:hypothetical protein